MLWSLKTSLVKQCLSLCYHSALRTMRQRESCVCRLWWLQTKPLRKKICIPLCPQQRGRVSRSLLCFSWQQPSCSWEQLHEVWSPGALPALTDAMGMKDAQQRCWHAKQGWEWTLLYGSSLQGERQIVTAYCCSWCWSKSRGVLQISVWDAGFVGGESSFLPCKWSTSVLEVAGRHKYWIADCRLQLLCDRILVNVNRDLEICTRRKKC